MNSDRVTIVNSLIMMYSFRRSFGDCKLLEMEAEPRATFLNNLSYRAE